jgi:hypothetical protein
MFSFTSLAVSFESCARSFSMSAPFLPMITPGRAAKIDTRHSLAGRSMTTLEIAACGRVSNTNLRISRSSFSS